MKDITGLLAGIRGETPPAEPYHPAIARRKARQEAREREGQAVTETRRRLLHRGQPDVRAAVMGAGSWGTTFAQVLCDAGTPAVLWARRAELAKAINASRENPDYLPGITLPDALRATADPAEALDGADLVVLAVPAQSLRENLAALGSAAAARRAAGQPDEGGRARHAATG